MGPLVNREARVASRPLVAAVVFAAATLATSPARATPTARLVYSRAPDAASCPDETALRRAVAARVGYDPFFPWAKVTVVAHLAKHGSAFVATVDLVDERGTGHGAQELRAEGACDELLDATALAIAIAIDPRALDPGLPSRPAPPPLPPLERAPPVAEEAEPPGHAAAEPPPRVVAPAAPVWELAGGAVVSGGVAPQLAPGLALGAAVRWSSSSLGLEGRIDAPTSRDAPQGGSVSAWLLTAILVPCAYAGPALACALLQVGTTRSSSAGVADARSGSSLWLAAGARIGVLIPLSDRVRLRLRSDVLFDLAPTALELDGVDVWTSPRLAASLGADAVVRFP